MGVDVITFGSATVDLFVGSEEFKLIKKGGGLAICEVYGAKIEVNRFALASGGGGTNTAVGLSRLGLKTAVVARMGQDLFSKIVIKDLEKEGVKTNLLISKPKDKTDFSVILVTPGGGRTILVYRGETRLEKEDIDFDKLSTAWFHLASLEGNLELTKKLVSFAYQKGVRVSWNPGRRELSFPAKVREILERVEVLVLNQEEMEELLEEKDKDRFWQKVFSLPTPLVAITRGKKGAWLAFPHKKKKIYHPAFPAEVVEETGAGDAFCSGLIAALLSGKSAGEALDWGLINGASVVSCFGAKAGLLKRRDLLRRLSQS